MLFLLLPIKSHIIYIKQIYNSIQQNEDVSP